MMFKATPEERAAFSKKIFDQVDAEDKARGSAKVRGDSALVVRTGRCAVTCGVPA